MVQREWTNRSDHFFPLCLIDLTHSARSPPDPRLILTNECQRPAALSSCVCSYQNQPRNARTAPAALSVL